ncbi:phosphotransferase [Diaporthe helianthi]|uniref:Phosphotransferase n=1 Tax=Diaporthe helianthi TaxID=158607 RepID=A0A2P5HHQ7_DIAHE|nr:phosphotransferase [Diaporthe helianthi]
MDSYFNVSTTPSVEQALEAYTPDNSIGPQIIQQAIADSWAATFIYYLYTQDAHLRQSVIDLVCKYRPGENPRLGDPWKFGSYNYNVEIIFDDGIVLFRFPIPGVAVYPDDKVKAEVATIRFVADHTSIPVPRIYHWGTAADNPTRLHVPFIIMEHIPHTTTIGMALDDPDFKIPSVPKSEKRAYLYQQMADISLQLYSLTSDRIGSLDILEEGGYAVNSGPLPHSIVNQVVNCSVPVSVLPPRSRIYSSSRDFFVDAVETHIAELLFMSEKFIHSATDCRKKFVARRTVRNLVRARLEEKQADQSCETFRLWGDDFRPESVLLDENGVVVGVVDWEYTYFAPETYHLNPPWWLLGEITSGHSSPDENSDAGADDSSDPSADASEGFPNLNELSSDIGDQEGEEGGDKDPYDWDGLVRAYLRALEEMEEKLQSDQKIRPVGNHLFSSSTKEHDVTAHTTRKLPLSRLMKHRWDEDTTEFALTTVISQIVFLDKYFWDMVDEQNRGENALGGYEARVELLDAPSRMLMEWFVHRRVDEIQLKDPKALLEQVLEQMDGKTSGLFAQNDGELD